MLTPDQARDLVTDAVRRATGVGADAADCVISSSGATQVTVRLGALEQAERSETTELGLRAFIGGRSASGSTSDLSPRAIETLAERVVAMARAAPEDRFAGLAPSDLIATGPFADFQLDDGASVEPETLKERALAAEDAARAVPGVTNSQGAGASHSRGMTALATSAGFTGVQTGSSHSVSATVLAGEGARLQRDYHYDSARHLEDLEDAEAIGREAGRRAVARLDPVRMKSGPVVVVFDPRTGGSLLGHFAGAITGASVARKTSLLLDRLGKAVFSPEVTIIDDPWRVRGMRSRAFDGEGLPTRPVTLIDDGVLTQWIAESASARQLGIAPTGHAGRGVSGAPSAGISNLHMAAGTLSPAELIADIAHGIYVTELIGMGVNALTGDYSRGAMGHVITDGVIGGAVSEVTIAGNLKAMYMALVPANDLEFRYATNVPTIRVDGMTLAGA